MTDVQISIHLQKKCVPILLIIIVMGLLLNVTLNCNVDKLVPDLILVVMKMSVLVLQ